MGLFALEEFSMGTLEGPGLRGESTSRADPSLRGFLNPLPHFIAPSSREFFRNVIQTAASTVWI